VIHFTFFKPVFWTAFFLHLNNCVYYIGVKEDAAKLISEANQRFLAAQEEAKKQQEEAAAEAARWKRNITSNWTR
jgi:hypothetical protein